MFSRNILNSIKEYGARRTNFKWSHFLKNICSRGESSPRQSGPLNYAQFCSTTFVRSKRLRWQTGLGFAGFALTYATARPFSETKGTDIFWDIDPSFDEWDGEDDSKSLNEEDTQPACTDDTWHSSATNESTDVQTSSDTETEQDTQDTVNYEQAYYASVLSAERAENVALIELAHAVRETLHAPQQSLLRVVAVVLYLDANGVKRHIVGTNCEASCFIHNSICAERSALAQLPQAGYSHILKVVIVSDAPQLLPPGALCREFLASMCGQDTQVVMCGSYNYDDYAIASVEELYPFGNIYTTMDRFEVVEFGRHLTSSLERPVEEDAAKLYAMARLAVKRDGNTFDLHPLSLGAAVAFDDGTIEVAWQKKSLEYSASLDPVSLLAMAIEKKRLEDSMPTLLLQVDQFGILHAPVAAARAFLSENDLNDVKILVHDYEGNLHEITAGELLPSVEDILGQDAKTISSVIGDDIENHQSP